MNLSSPWTRAETVAGFAQAPPNQTLLAFAASERDRIGRSGLALDLGCGAGRNAVPLAGIGFDVVGIDDSAPMLTSAHARLPAAGGRLHLVRATMDAVPLGNACADLVVAHGIWNLARSGAEFRRGVREAARVSRPGGALFVFTFSRSTLPAQASPVAGEEFVFTGFSGDPQCFVTAEQLIAELAGAGFAREPGVPLAEHNLPKPGSLQTAGVPVIFETAFRYRG